MSRVRELFTFSVEQEELKWRSILKSQHCRYSGKRCFKVRKSQAAISIGTCTVRYGADDKDVIICPQRLLERKQIFADCLHLLTSHQPGNELHLVREVSVPGGSVDYFLVSTDSNRKVKDFVGIELQTMDTTGTVWPERELALQELGLKENVPVPDKNFGMNWKMTAKTILVQLHHKIDTFESINKHLVLIVQDHLLEYMRKEFVFAYVNSQPLIGDSMHFHSYKLKKEDTNYRLVLDNRLSTDSDGISKLLGLNANANVGFDEIAKVLEVKISDATIFTIA
ncbi:NotI family restriction endonuclease [Segatella baroniae]|uniref:NotI family restriction endonuclease n=1 Tax=Segatella baroniae TaxID=305719 RepID=UPI00041962CA|nr:NotI family restriction endonuclease [Segatella baroniae]